MASFYYPFSEFFFSPILNLRSDLFHGIPKHFHPRHSRLLWD
jgi:hypothetical protein